uniref:DUF4378 domain-containing protein n=1 Tax=Schistocephalus solidus TaxID=70667 RepID=A0A183T672_SCHSO
LRDAFWEALLKEPRDRTVEDIETLVENVQKLPCFVCSTAQPSASQHGLDLLLGKANQLTTLGIDLLVQCQEAG